MPEPTVRPLPRVDVRAARLSQGLLAVAGLHLALAAALGRRGNVAVLFFDAVLRPRLGPPAWEDARPPRFASLVGAAVVAAALVAHAAGAAALGWSLAAVVGALAGVAAATGACVGCWLYGYLGPFRGLVRWIG